MGRGRGRGTAGAAIGVATLVVALWVGTAAAEAGEVRVRVLDVRSDRGQVLVALCEERDFLARSCALTGAAGARAGTTEVVIRDVPPGVYAAQAVHDENANQDLDRNALGLPLEGFGFSRDAPLRAGPPRFEEAAVEVPVEGGVLSFALRYF